MKIWKKIISIVMAAAMLLAVSTTVLAYDFTYDHEAAGGGSIYIHKYDATGVTLTKDADGTIMGDSTVIGTKDGNDVSLGNLKAIPGIPFKIEEVVLTASGDPEDPDDYEVKIGGITSTLETDATGTLAWKNLPEGIYRITELANDTANLPLHSFLVRLPFTDPLNPDRYLDDVHVYPKNTVTPPPIEKEYVPGENGITAGDVLNWRITVGIPDDIGTAREFKITDTLSAYHEYQTGSTSIYYIDDKGDKIPLTIMDNDYILAETASGITVNLTTGGMKKLGDAIDGNTMDDDQKLYIEYRSKITITAEELAALTDPVTNKAVIDFTNGSGYKYDPNETEVEKQVYGLVIHKVDKDGNTILAPAKFSVYSKIDENGVVADSIVADKDGNTVFTTVDGYATIAGLNDGTYYIVETEAPAGYNKMTGYLTVTINSASADTDTKLLTVEFTNLKGFELPKTGGMGTILFTACGAAMIGAAIMLLIFAKRKKIKKTKKSV